MGLLSIASIIRPDFVLPAAIVTGLYYGLAGGLHLRSVHRNARETLAMASDLWVFCVLAFHVAMTLSRPI